MESGFCDRMQPIVAGLSACHREIPIHWEESLTSQQSSVSTAKQEEKAHKDQL